MLVRIRRFDSFGKEIPDAKYSPEGYTVWFGEGTGEKSKTEIVKNREQIFFDGLSRDQLKLRFVLKLDSFKYERIQELIRVYDQELQIFENVQASVTTSDQIKNAIFEP